MAIDPVRATLTIKRQDGTVERWGFDLSPTAPNAKEQLKAALVVEFIGENADADTFDFEEGGTRAAPAYTLAERRTTVASNRRLLDPD